MLIYCLIFTTLLMYIVTLRCISVDFFYLGFMYKLLLPVNIFIVCFDGTFMKTMNKYVHQIFGSYSKIHQMK